jgi:protease-4
MSPSNREQIQELIGSIWNTVAADIASERQVAEADLNRIADTLGGRNAEYALASRLIDGILYADQYESRIKQATGLAESDDQDYIVLEDYLRLAKNKKVYKGTDKIAVIFAQGEMLYGEGGPNYIGQVTINEALASARDNDAVKAVVLRINSPGGSALTSELIWREIERTKAVKPLVVSMGDVTASAGYYIASGADRILAEPTTITGSIGVFAVVPNIHELASNIGINAEQVGTHRNATEYSLFEPLGETFKEVATEGIEDTYELFLQRVAEGRDISTERADSLAQGRVWSGADAQRIGLVDELGGLDEAIAEAAALAGLDNYSIRKYPRYKSGFARLMEDLGETGQARQDDLIRSELGVELYNMYKELSGTLKQKGVQARMPYILNIK